MKALALNIYGDRFSYSADIVGGRLSLDKILSDVFQNCFAFERDDAAVDFDSTALLDIQDVKNSLEGDNEAYKRIVERHQRKIAAMMWRFSRDRVVHEELVQDVFVQVFMSLGTYKRKAPFTHWLYRVATRVGFSYWKKKAREKRMEMVSFEDFDQDKMAVTESIKPNEAAEMLHKMLEKLSPRDRLVLTLRYLQQNTIEETAKLTGWGISMVKVQTWRAKNKLKKIIEQYESQAGD